VRKFLASAVAFGLVAVGTSARAQDTDTQLWTQQNATIPVEGPFGVSLDFTQRFGEDADGMYEAVGGFFLTFKASDTVTIGAGYNHTTGFRAGPNTQEDRPRQQISLKLGHFSGRWRLEERMRSDGNGLGVRTRVQLRWAQPFHKGGDLEWVVYHESFVALNDTDWGQKSGYSRMRNFIGLHAPLTGTVEIEGGYLNQYDFKPGRDAMANVALVSLSVGFQALSGD